MARLAVKHVAEVFQCERVVLLPDAAGRLRYPHETPMDGSYRGADLAIAQWVADHGRRAGLGSDTLPAAPALYLPLSDERQRPRRAGRAAAQSAARAAARAAAPARNVRGPDRPRARARAARGDGGAGARVAAETRDACATRCSRRSRTTCGRRWPRWPARQRRWSQRGSDARRGDAHGRSRARSRRRRATCRSSCRTCST